MPVPTELTDEQIEHLAYGAAIGLWSDPEIETLCDAAASRAGVTASALPPPVAMSWQSPMCSTTCSRRRNLR